LEQNSRVTISNVQVEQPENRRQELALLVTGKKRQSFLCVLLTLGLVPPGGMTSAPAGLKKSFKWATDCGTRSLRKLRNLRNLKGLSKEMKS